MGKQKTRITPRRIILEKNKKIQKPQSNAARQITIPKNRTNYERYQNLINQDNARTKERMPEPKSKEYSIIVNHRNEDKVNIQTTTTKRSKEQWSLPQNYQRKQKGHTDFKKQSQKYHQNQNITHTHTHTMQECLNHESKQRRRMSKTKQIFKLSKNNKGKKKEKKKQNCRPPFRHNQVQVLSR